MKLNWRSYRHWYTHISEMKIQTFDYKYYICNRRSMHGGYYTLRYYISNGITISHACHISRSKVDRGLFSTPAACAALSYSIYTAYTRPASVETTIFRWYMHVYSAPTLDIATNWATYASLMYTSSNEAGPNQMRVICIYFLTNAPKRTKIPILVCYTFQRALYSTGNRMWMCFCVGWKTERRYNYDLTRCSR